MKKLLISILFVLLLAGTGWAEGGDSQSYIPTGVVWEYDGDISDVNTLVEPIPGWYWMNGAIASDTDMPVLAARINKKHNRPGDPTDSTRLADRRGVYGKGFGQNAYLGANYANASGTPTADTMESHTHLSSFNVSGGGGSNLIIPTGSVGAGAPASGGSSGRTGNVTEPANVGTHYIIKY